MSSVRAARQTTNLGRRRVEAALQYRLRLQGLRLIDGHNDHRLGCYGIFFRENETEARVVLKNKNKNKNNFRVQHCSMSIAKALDCVVTSLPSAVARLMLLVFLIKYNRICFVTIDNLC